MKADAATIRARVDAILAVMLDGAMPFQVRQFVADQEAKGEPPWTILEGGKPLSERQIRRYCDQADRLVDEACRTSRKKLLRRHVAKRRNLYSRCVNSGDYSGASRILRDEAELLGLYPPKKIAPTTPDGSKPYDGSSLTEAERLAALEALYARVGGRGGGPLLAGKPTPMDRFWLDRAAVLKDAGLTPDPWQADLLCSSAQRILLLCTRQAGKSTAASALALLTAFCEGPALVLLLSPTLRQSGELFRDKVMRLYASLGTAAPPARRQTQLELELVNGSRIVSLPESEGGIRGFSDVALLVIDEASRVGTDLYHAVTPMLAVSGGRLVALSTPYVRDGWYFEAWEDGGAAWQRFRVTADQCPRISADFLASERRAMTPRFFEREYFCVFSDSAGSMFDHDSIRRALRPGGEPPLYS